MDRASDNRFRRMCQAIQNNELSAGYCRLSQRDDSFDLAMLLNAMQQNTTVESFHWDLDGSPAPTALELLPILIKPNLRSVTLTCQANHVVNYTRYDGLSLQCCKPTRSADKYAGETLEILGRHCKGIETLCIVDCYNFSPSSLASFLTNTVSIRALMYDENRIDLMVLQRVFHQQDLKELQEAMTKNKTLEELHITKSPSPLVGAMLRGSIHNSVLKVLKVSFVCDVDFAMPELQQVLLSPECHLRELSLTACEECCIDDWPDLITNLAQHGSLRTLQLSLDYEPCPKQVTNALRYLLDNSLPPTMETLHLEDLFVSRQDFEELVSGLASSQTIKRVTLPELTLEDADGDDADELDEEDQEEGGLDQGNGGHGVEDATATDESGATHSDDTERSFGKHIEHLLLTNSVLEELSLEAGCFNGLEDLSAIGRGLVKNCTLKSLTVLTNSTLWEARMWSWDDRMIWEAFFTGLIQNSSLQELSLGTIGPNAGTYLVEYLKENTTLRKLSISGNDPTIEAILCALTVNTTLAHLSIPSGGPFKCRLGQILPDICGLRSIVIYQDGEEYSREDAELLVEGLRRNRSLVDVDLRQADPLLRWAASFYTLRNRCLKLMDPSVKVPAGLWADIIEKSLGSKSGKSLSFFLLSTHLTSFISSRVQAEA